MPIALDSNVLLYFFGLRRAPGDELKILQAQQVVNRLSQQERFLLPYQVLGGVYAVLTQKKRASRTEALAFVDGWRANSDFKPSWGSAFEAGLTLATRHDFQIWDAVIIAVAAEAGCELLLSEDMQDGFTWRGLTIVNPFAAAHHPRLAALLGS